MTPSLPFTLRSLLLAILAVFAALCIFNAYSVGKKDGVDGALNYGAQSNIFALAIAISEKFYGFDQGYVGRPEVEDAIKKILMPPDPLQQKALAGNKNAVEAALQAAISLDPSTFTRYKSTRAPFVIMGAEDTGLVDFYKLSFTLFGYHADAMYRCFFLLLSISSILLLVQSRGKIWPALLLVVVLFSFNMLLYTDIFTGRVDAPNVNSSRNLGTLSLIATLHLMLFSQMRSRYAVLTDWAFWSAQMAILLFVITIRTSGMWQLIALVSWLAIPLGWWCLRHLRRRHFLRSLLTGFRLHQKYLIPLLLIIAAYQINNHERLERHDDVYFSECAIPHHLRWHSAYMALGMHPEWSDYAPIGTMGVYQGDGMVWNIANNLWKRSNPDKSYACPYFPLFYRLGVHERYVFKAFRQFARENPKFIAELYFIHKPKALYERLYGSIQSIPTWWLQAVSALAAMFALSGFIAGITRTPFITPLFTSGGALGWMLMMSNLPHLFAYPVYMAETFTLLLACMAFAICAAAALCAGLLGKAMPMDRFLDRRV